MKRTKTLLAFLAVLTLTANTGRAAVFHFSAVAPTGQTLYYKIISEDDREVRITYPKAGDNDNYYDGYPKPTGVLVVPDSVEHEGVWYRVTDMNWQTFMNCDSLTSVTLPYGITEISGNAFFGCTRLTEVNLPGSVEEIQSAAFRECSSLETINLPEGVRVIWGQAFCLCTSLRTIHLSSTLENVMASTFVDCNNIDTVWIAAVEPPLCGSSQYPQLPAFTDNNAVLVVPCGSESAYHNAYGWENFSEIISDCDGIEGADISSVTIYALGGRIVVEGVEGEVVRIFDITGHSIRNNSLPAGVYLVKIGDRPARKVVVMK